MFGQRTHFNINGEETHRTAPGACVSLFIIAWIGVIIAYLIKDIVIDNKDRPLTETFYPNYYGKNNSPLQQ